MFSKKPKEKQFSGFPGDLSPEQQQKLEQFREYVKQQFQYEQGNGKLDQSQAVMDDAYLLRFLRAREFNIQKTKDMWENCMKWRDQNGIDTIFKDYTFSELKQVREFYPHGYHRQDKMGRPIYIERIGKLNLQSLFQITQEDRLIKYYCQSYECLLSRIFPSCSVAQGNRVDQTFTILDLKGSTMKMMSKSIYNFIQLAAKIGQDNYPEILGKMFIVNAPMLFTGIWQVIKPWLDEKTRNKITIIGGSYQKKLLEYVDAENLPEFLGGKCKCNGDECNLGKNVGCWNIKGEKGLYPGEEGFDESFYGSSQELDNGEKGKEEKKDQQDDDDEDEQNPQDFDQLKNALLNMGVGQPNVQKAPCNPNKYGQTQGNMMVSDTPLNTQIEEADGEYDNMNMY